MSLGSGLNYLGKNYIRIRTNIPGSGSGFWINDLIFGTESLGLDLF